MDDDVAGLNVIQSGTKLAGMALPVDETGHIEAFNVALDQRPNYDVTVTIATSEPTEVVLAYGGQRKLTTVQLVFNDLNFDGTVH